MYDLVVLGGGSGGLTVASAAARVGAKVALIDKGRLGGECTFSACVPSKALIRAAQLAHEIRGSAAYGLRVGTPEVDFSAVMARIRAVVEQFAASDSDDVMRARGIDVYRGSAAFDAYDTILVDGTTRVEGRRFVIATGSRPAIPPISGLVEAGFLDNVSIWNLNHRPETLAVIGGGPVGIEFAQALARLGTQVTVLTDSERILPREDPEVSNFVQSVLAAEGIAFHTHIEITGVVVRDGQKVVKFRSKLDGATFEAARGEILVAAGRRANVEGMNLEAVGVHADPEHGIAVNDYLRTDSPNIWAIGDVLGGPDFTHAAEREAVVAFQNAVLRLPKKMNYTTLPWATFTDPEVATVGSLAAPEATEDVQETRLFRVEMAEVDRARIDGRTTGFAKLRATPAGRILGVTIVGAEAGTVLQEFVVAIEHGLTLNDLAGTVHTYPTYSGLARNLAVQFSATRLERGYVQRALRWFYGFEPRLERSTIGAEAEPAPEHKPEPMVAADGHGH